MGMRADYAAETGGTVGYSGSMSFRSTYVTASDSVSLRPFAPCKQKFYTLNSDHIFSTFGA